MIDKFKLGNIYIDESIENSEPMICKRIDNVYPNEGYNQSVGMIGEISLKSYYFNNLKNNLINITEQHKIKEKIKFLLYER